MDGLGGGSNGYPKWLALVHENKDENVENRVTLALSF